MSVILNIPELRRREKFMRARVRAALQDILHCDANETAFLERQLTYQRARVHEVKFAELLARSFLPIASDIPSSAETYVYFVYSHTGRGRITANGAGDIPRVDVQATEVTGKVRSITAGYGWDINSMREAARQAIDLPGKKARAARRVIDTSIDEMLAFGDLELSTGQTGVRCEGLVNNADSEGIGIGNPDNDPWEADSDPLDIVADMSVQASTVVTTSLQTIIPDTLLYAPREYEIIASKPIGDNAETTILQWFLKNSPYIKRIEQWHRLTGAGAAGANRSVCYKNDPEVLEGVVPQEFEQLPPQAENLEFKIPCHGRCGGVKIYQPLGVRYTDFATS